MVWNSRASPASFFGGKISLSLSENKGQTNVQDQQDQEGNPQVVVKP
jgi:hypothetical protein